ncbi:MAG: hypothetical protein OEW87_11580 [Flavobacteriaceae bacterium]|nr:hypothetical protein [Flavobacteriaceae bacterium]
MQSRFPACRSSEQAGFSARSKTGKNLCTLVAILGVFLFANTRGSTSAGMAVEGFYVKHGYRAPAYPIIRKNNSNMFPVIELIISFVRKY